MKSMKEESNRYPLIATHTQMRASDWDTFSSGKLLKKLVPIATSNQMMGLRLCPEQFAQLPKSLRAREEKRLG